MPIYNHLLVSVAEFTCNTRQVESEAHVTGLRHTESTPAVVIVAVVASISDVVCRLKLAATLGLTIRVIVPKGKSVFSHNQGLVN